MGQANLRNEWYEKKGGIQVGGKHYRIAYVRNVSLVNANFSVSQMSPIIL